MSEQTVDKAQAARGIRNFLHPLRALLDLADQLETLAGVETSIREAEGRLEQMRAHEGVWREHRELVAQVEALRCVKDQLAGELEQGRADITSALADTRGELDEATARLADLESKIATANATLADVDKKVDAKRGELSEIEAGLRRLQLRLVG